MKHACEHISQLASARLERELSLLESLRLRLHLLMCSACRHYNNGLHTLHLTLSKRQQHASSIQLPEDKRQSIKQALKDKLS